MQSQVHLQKIKRDFNLIYSFAKNIVFSIWNGLNAPYRAKRFRYFLGRIHFFLTDEENVYPIPNSEPVKKLKRLSEGLHQLLPKSNVYSYSILIPVQEPKPEYFKMALESALSQTAPEMEVLVGFYGQQSKEVYHVFDELFRAYPTKLKSFEFALKNEIEVINAIEMRSKGNFLLLMDQEDWIRPDLLFRYEQTLRLQEAPKKTILYCNEYKIDEKSYPIPFTGSDKPEQPCFPYLFANWISKCLLIPKDLWKKVHGMRQEAFGAHEYDLILRLNTAGAKFLNVPIYLYAKRFGKKIPLKHESQEAILSAFQDYIQAKGLNWKVEQGYLPKCCRAIPKLKNIPSIHVIIPYHNQKKLTISAIKHILVQQGVNIKVTAVDNNSTDASIAPELEALGVEVLKIAEPFNYSRLNNLAVHSSRLGAECKYLLFLNNDVDLAIDAVEEMCRWIDQPGIGMVGCRLNYPNGNLQHGGMDLDKNSPTYRMSWVHSEKHRSFELLEKTKTIRISDALTGACILMKRQEFLSLGGFDEIWYPIACSDTLLAIKLKAKKQACLYTPYAVGIHHESASRPVYNLEDYEMLRWLQNKIEKKIELNELSNPHKPF